MISSGLSGDRSDTRMLALLRGATTRSHLLRNAGILAASGGACVLAQAEEVAVASLTTTAAAGASGASAAAPSGASAPALAAAPTQFLEDRAFRCYDSRGQPLAWSAVLGQVSGQGAAAQHAQPEVWLLGEVHDDAVAHALELQLWRAAVEASAAPGAPRRHVPVLSLEMFETDAQVVMDEWLAGLVRDRDLLVDGRAWPNHVQDYHPMVQLAKQHRLPVVCANAPRRMVSLAGKRGAAVLGELPAASRALLPPLPVRPASEPYRRRIAQVMALARAGAAQASKASPPAAAADAAPNQGPGAAAPPSFGPGAPAPPAGGARPSSAPQAPPRPAPAAATGAAAATAGARTHADSRGPGRPQGPGQGAAGDGATTDATPKEEGKDCPYIGLNLSSNFFDAQNLWDACMAHRISQALQRAPGRVASEGAAARDDASQPPPHQPLVLHVCGKAHCEGRLGIVEHLAHYAPHARVRVLTFVPARTVHLTPAAFAAEGLVGLADVVVLTDGTLQRSFESMHPA